MSYVILDLETTGFGTLTDSIMEVAAIIYDGKKAPKEYCTLLKPHCRVSAGAFAKHGITYEEAFKNGKTQFKGLSDLVDFVGDLPLVAHNGITFDFQFLCNQMRRYNVSFGNNRLIDTLPLAEKYLKSKRGERNLETLCADHGVENTQAHRALADTKALAQIFDLILIKESNLDTLWKASKSRLLSDLGERAEIYVTLHEAMKNGTDLQIDYEGENNPRSIRWIKPIEFDTTTDNNYKFKAFCYKDETDKNFVVSRIHNVVQVGRHKVGA